MALTQLLLIAMFAVCSAEDPKLLVVVEENQSVLEWVVTNAGGVNNYQEVFVTVDEYGLFSAVNKVCSSKEAYVGILDLTPSLDCTLANMAATMDLPYLSVFGRDCVVEGNPASLTIKPPDDVYLAAATALAVQQLHENPYHIAIFYDDSFDMDIIPSGDIDDKGALFFLARMDSAVNGTNLQLQNIRKDMAVRTFIVLASVHNAQNILDAACEQELLYPYYNWFWVSKEIGQPQPSGCNNGTIAYLHHDIVEPDLYQLMQGKATDNYNANDTLKQILQIDASYVYDSFLTLVRYLDEHGQHPASLDCTSSTTHEESGHEHLKLQHFITYLLDEQAEGILGPLGIDPRRNVPLLTLTINRLTLTRLPESNAPATEVEKIGEWMNGREPEVQLDVPHVFPEHTNAKWRILTTPEPPFVFKLNDADCDCGYSGYTIDVLVKIAERLNFTFEIREPEDGQYGSLLDNGQWSGMIGELERGKADMAAAPMSVTLERDTVVDFTTPYYEYAGIRILIKKQEAENNLFTFVDVFHYEVWIVVFAVLLGITLLVYLLDKFSPFSYRNRKDQFPDGGKIYSIKESAWFVMGAFTKSGEGDAPKALSSRILLAGFWFFCSVIMATYTANLAAFLTVSRMQVSISSLDSLAAQTSVQYSVVRGSDTETYFKHMALIEDTFYNNWKTMSLGSTSPNSADRSSEYAVWDYPLGDKYTIIWNRMKDTGLLNSTAEGVAKVKQGDFAFLNSGPVLLYEAGLVCDLAVVGDQFSTKPVAFALQQNSPLVDQISNAILDLQRDRVLDSLKKKWWTDKQVQCSNDNQEGSGITLSKVGGVFISMAGGIGVSLFILAVEIFCSKIGDTQQRKAKVDEMNHNDVSVVGNGHVDSKIKAVSVQSNSTEPPIVAS